ncbi:probable receptor-like protein kinase isoform X1, partial [Tanacetum coccineum]
ALSPEAGWLSEMDKLKLEQHKDMELTKSDKNVLDLEVTSSYRSSTTSAQPCRRFTLAEILFATKDFDEQLVIGQGRYGKVYRGQISSEKSGHVVAIRRLVSIAKPAEVDFKEQIQILSTLRHQNLVPLIGYCDDYKERCGVHEYMSHGTLYDHLHNAKTPLTWVQRMEIAIGAARGLEYLHTGSGIQYGVIHFAVKSSNILLDDKWEAMISDFGLSKIVSADQSLAYATFGYLDPEYFLSGRATTKTDVYAFGIVLFELLSGRLPVDIQQTEQPNLASWAKKCVKERKFEQMVDSNIKGTISPRSLRRFAQLADRCLLTDLIKRPTMSEVVASLQDIIELQEKNDDSAKSSTGTSSKLKKWFGL